MRTIIPAVLLLLVMTQASCGSSDNVDTHLSEDEGTYLSIDFEPLALSFQRIGFVSAAQVYDRQYFFPTDNYAANLSLLSDWERIIGKIDDLICFTAVPLEIFLYKDEAEHEQFNNGRNIFINQHDFYSFGRLVHRLSGELLPMWLSAGLEAAARSYFDMNIPEFDGNPLTGFGDIYFTPMSWGSRDHAQAIGTAYLFVMHLIEIGRLSDLAGLYLGQETSLANEMVMGRFYEFAGKPMDTTFSVHFHGNVFFHASAAQNVAYDYRISTATDFGNYHFLFTPQTDDLDIQSILEYVHYFDDSVRFVEDFFAEFAEFDFRPVDTFIIYSGHSIAPVDAHLHDGWIRMFNFSSHTPSVFVHEITHFLSFWSQNNGLGPFELEEGLAMSLMSYHDIYDRWAHGLSYRWHRENEFSYTGSSYIQALHDIFKDADIAEAVWNLLMADFDSIGISHMYAYFWLHYRDYEAQARMVGAYPPKAL
ncbi:MAG: hypothetical protein FWE20_06040 [Defluviitaleaceae bacterium]|nr:hypothetical protein [Defluviitaleaceae bacterium]